MLILLLLSCAGDPNLPWLRAREFAAFTSWTGEHEWESWNGAGASCWTVYDSTGIADHAACPECDFVFDVEFVFRYYFCTGSYDAITRPDWSAQVRGADNLVTFDDGSDEWVYDGSHVDEDHRLVYDYAEPSDAYWDRGSDEGFAVLD